MRTKDIAEAIMKLPDDGRLELARRIIASVVVEQQRSEQVRDAVQDIEDVLAGKVHASNEGEFQTALE